MSVRDAVVPVTSTQRFVAQRLANRVSLPHVWTAIYERCDELRFGAFGGDVLETPGSNEGHQGITSYEGRMPDGWFPLNNDGAGNYIALDERGRIIEYGRDVEIRADVWDEPEASGAKRPHNVLFDSTEHVLAATTLLVEEGMWDRVFADGRVELCFAGYPVFQLTHPSLATSTRRWIPERRRPTPRRAAPPAFSSDF